MVDFTRLLLTPSHEDGVGRVGNFGNGPVVAGSIVRREEGDAGQREGEENEAVLEHKSKDAGGRDFDGKDQG